MILLILSAIDNQYIDLFCSSYLLPKHNMNSHLFKRFFAPVLKSMELCLCVPPATKILANFHGCIVTFDANVATVG